MKKPKQQPLTEPKRRCEVCGCSGSYNAKKMAAGEPVIMAFNITIYRRTRLGGAQQATAKRALVCESCFVQITASQGRLGAKGESLALALFERAKDCYSGLVVATEKKLAKAEAAVKP